MSGVAAAAADITTQLAAVPDDSSASFDGLDNRISINHMTAFFDVASNLGDALTSAPDRLAAIGGACASTAPLTQTCFDTFLNSFGRRALRRPLTADEMTSFHTLNDGMSPPVEVLRMAVTKLLLSPSFLNHVQVDGAPINSREDYLKLSPYEVASRLSYHFWQTMPDQALLTAAEDGSLGTDAGYQAAVQGLVADPRAKDTAWTFWSQWLKTGGSSGSPPIGPRSMRSRKARTSTWPDTMSTAIWCRSCVISPSSSPGSAPAPSAISWRPTSRSPSPPISPTSMVSRPGTAASDYAKFPAGTRSGLLTRSAVLVIGEEQTNPFHRGATVRRSFLCDDLPKPDPAALPPGSLDPPPASATQTTRDRFGAKVKSSLCQGCHSQFSNIGFVLEAYDSLGRYRTKEKIFDTQTGMLQAELPIDLGRASRGSSSTTSPM